MMARAGAERVPVMTPFTTLTGVAVPIDTVNLDTDQLLPARYLRRPRDDRYPSYLFHDLRFGADGSERPDFVLNRAPYRRARIIVGAQNFGCGSSREAAVFALVANDIRAVLAPSFGDIFFNNCAKNGVLAIRLDAAATTGLRAALHAAPGAAMTIDLAAQRITAPDGATLAFDIDPFRKRCLLEGLDDIALTLEHEAAIAAFEDRYRADADWLFD